MLRLYEAQYGKMNGSSFCSFKGILKLFGFFFLALIGLIIILAFTNQDWEGWELLMPDTPVIIILFLANVHILQNQIFFLERLK